MQRQERARLQAISIKCSRVHDHRNFSKLEKEPRGILPIIIFVKFVRINIACAGEQDSWTAISAAEQYHH